MGPWQPPNVLPSLGDYIQVEATFEQRFCILLCGKSGEVRDEGIVSMVDPTGPAVSMIPEPQDWRCKSIKRWRRCIAGVLDDVEVEEELDEKV